MRRGLVVSAVLVFGGAAYLTGVATGQYHLFPYRLLKAAQDRLSSVAAGSPDLDRGRDLFRAQCAQCHGPRGEGGRGPALTHLGLRAPEVARIAEHGIPGTEMPGSWMPREEGLSLAAYVLSLSDSAPGGGPAVGDAAGGRRLFYGSAGCNGCHRVSGVGGGPGPDLTDIGERRSAAYLRQSLTHPAAALSPGYQLVRIESDSGPVAEGLLLDRDQFNVDIRDLRRNALEGFEAESVRVEPVDSSWMPAAGGRLSDAQVDDLVAYLLSLKG